MPRSHLAAATATSLLCTAEHPHQDANQLSFVCRRRSPQFQPSQIPQFPIVWEGSFTSTSLSPKQDRTKPVGRLKRDNATETIGQLYIRIRSTPVPIQM